MTNVSVRKSTGKAANKEGANSLGIVHIPSSSSPTTPSISRKHLLRFKTTWLKLVVVALSTVVCFRTFSMLRLYSSTIDTHGVMIDNEIEQIQPQEIYPTPLLLQSQQHKSSSSSMDNSYPSIDLSIPGKTPRETIKIGEFSESTTGGATLDMFKGQWELIPDNTTSHLDPVTCPYLAEYSQKFACDYTTSNHGGRRYKQYNIVSDLIPFNASFLVQKTKERGPIMFVGDSMSGQMKDALICLIESQLGEWDESMDKVTFFSSTAIPIDTSSMEDIEVRPSEAETQDEFDNYVDLSWAEEAVEKNVSYLVFNTGPWWNNELNFRVRGPWCDYDKWRYVSGVEMVEIYERSFRSTVIPILRRLRDDHGIVTIWRDVSAAGMWNERRNNVMTSRKSHYYMIFPVLNRIGRRLVTELADGLMLPIFDMSLDRWDDHIFADASYTNFDPMHWCIHYNERDVPAVWNRLLFQVLFGDDDKIGSESAAAAAATIRNESPLTTDTIQSGVVHGEETTEINNIQSLRTNRKLRVELERVPYSRSNETECSCSDAQTFYHCVANIACQWVETTEPYHCAEKKTQV